MGALGAPDTLQQMGNSFFASVCLLQLPRAFLCQKHSVSICSAAINQRDAHMSMGWHWAPWDWGLGCSEAPEAMLGPGTWLIYFLAFQCDAQCPQLSGVPGRSSRSLTSPGCLPALQSQQSKQRLLCTQGAVPEHPKAWLGAGVAAECPRIVPGSQCSCSQPGREPEGSQNPCTL